MRSRFLAVVVFGFTLGACASTPTPTPPLFLGAAGWETVPGTTQFIGGTVGEETAIAVREVEFLRTGRLVEPIKNNWGVTKHKAESAAYAGLYGGSYGVLGQTVAWCIPGEEDPSLGNLLMGRDDVDCYTFNRSSGNANGLSGSGQSAFYSPRLTGKANVFYKLPVIREEPVDFGRIFTLSLMVQSLSGDTFESFVRFDDGVGKTDFQVIKHTPDSDGVAVRNLWGGQLKLTRIGDGDGAMVSVEEVRPLVEISAEEYAKAMDVLAGLARLAAERAKAVEAATETPAE